MKKEYKLLLSILVLISISACGFPFFSRQTDEIESIDDLPTRIIENTKVSDEEDMVEESPTPIPDIEEDNLDDATPEPNVEEEEDIKVRWSIYYDGDGRYNQFIQDNLIINEAYEIENHSHLHLDRYYSYDENAIYITNRNGYVEAFDFESLNLIWESEFEGNILGIGQETILVHTDNNRIYGLDKQNGAERWRIIINMLISDDESCTPFPNVEVRNGISIVPMFYLDEDNDESLRFLHIDENNGDAVITDINPEVPKPTSGYRYSPAYYFDEDLVFSALINEALFSLNMIDGSVNWNQEVDYDPILGLVIEKFDREKKKLYLTILKDNEDSDQYRDLYCIDLATGESIWEAGLRRLNDQPENKMYDYYFFYDRYIFNYIYKSTISDIESKSVDVYDKETGYLVNSFTSDRSFVPILSEEILIINFAKLGITRGIDPFTNEIIWEKDEGDVFYQIFADGIYKSFNYHENIYVITGAERPGNSRIVAIEKSTGDILWTQDLRINSDPNYVIYNQNLLYYYGSDIFNINFEDGTVSKTNLGFQDNKIEHVQVINENLLLLVTNRHISLLEVNW